MFKNYRMYFFGNMYISQIQHGIQAAHVVAEMFSKYKFSSSMEPNYLHEWAANHKTMILLNGGYQTELEKALFLIENSKVIKQLPYAFFREEKSALNDALTSVGILLPDVFYAVDPEKINEFRFSMHKLFGADESENIVKFVEFLQSKRLA